MTISVSKLLESWSCRLDGNILVTEVEDEGRVGRYNDKPIDGVLWFCVSIPFDRSVTQPITSFRHNTIASTVHLHTVVRASASWKYHWQIVISVRMFRLWRRSLVDTIWIGRRGECPPRASNNQADRPAEYLDFLVRRVCCSCCWNTWSVYQPVCLLPSCSATLWRTVCCSWGATRLTGLIDALSNSTEDLRFFTTSTAREANPSSEEIQTFCCLGYIVLDFGFLVVADCEWCILRYRCFWKPGRCQSWMGVEPGTCGWQSDCFTTTPWRRKGELCIDFSHNLIHMYLVLLNHLF